MRDLKPAKPFFCILVLLALTLFSQANGMGKQTLLVIQNHYTETSGDLTVVHQPSNPILAVLPNSSLLAAFSFDRYICGKISNDYGSSWSQIFVIKTSETPYVASLGSMVVSGNKVFLFYLRWISYSFVTGEGNSSLWKLESSDNGQTWTDDVRIDGGRHDYVCTGTSALRTRNGTLIVPFSWAMGFDSSLAAGIYEVAMLRSDDDGTTWTEGQKISVPESATGVDEPAIVELANGSLYCLMRTYFLDGAPKHVAAVSDDYGLTWSLSSKVNEMDAYDSTPGIFRYSWNPGIILAAWINRTCGPGGGGGTWSRTPLVVAYSDDNAVSWKNVTAFDDGLTSQNEPCFASAGWYVILGYRRNTNAKNPVVDAVARRFRMSLFFDRETFETEFGSQRRGLTDLNADGIVDILDALLVSAA